MDDSNSAGRKYLSDGQFALAMSAFDECIKSDRTNWETHYLRAVAVKAYALERFLAYLQEENFDGSTLPLPDDTYTALLPSTEAALSEFAASCKANPSSRTLGGRLILSEITLNVTRYQLARTKALHVVRWGVESLQEALRLNPTSAEAADLLGELSALGTSGSSKSTSASVGSPSNSPTIALVLGLLSLCCCGIFTGIPAAIMGAMELQAIKEGRSPQSGQGLAMAGLVTGIIGSVLAIAGVLLWVLVILLSLHN